MRRFLQRRLLPFAAVFACGAALWLFLHHDRKALPVEPKNAGGIAFDKRNEALVYVGEDVISSDDINWEADQYLQTLPQDPAVTVGEEDDHSKRQALDSLREKLLEAAIERKLLVNLLKRDKNFDLRQAVRFKACDEQFEKLSAEKKVVPNSQDGKRLKAYLCDNSLVEQYFSESIYKPIKVTPEEVKDFFEKNKEKYHTPEKVVIRQIVLPSEEEAKRVRARVNAGNFRALAKQVSIAPEAEREGLLRAYAKGEMPAVFDVAFSMKVGEISGIQKSNYGFHILMLEKKTGKREADLAAVRGRIQAELLESKKKDEYKRQLELAINTIQVKRPRPLW